EENRLGEGNIRLDFEVLGGESPTTIPVDPKLIGFCCGQPARLRLSPAQGSRQLTAVQMRYPGNRLPAKNRVVHVPVSQLLHGKRSGPATLIWHVSQKPPRLLVIGLPLENRAQAHARKRILRRIGRCSALGQFE